MRHVVLASLVEVVLAVSSLSAQPYDYVVAGRYEMSCRFAAVIDPSSYLQWIVGGARGMGGPRADVVAPAPRGEVIAAIESGGVFHVDFVMPNGSSRRIGTAPPGYTPRAMVASNSGAIYVLAHGTPIVDGDWAYSIIAFGPTGAVTGVHPLTGFRPWGIDLAADQCTLFMAGDTRVARFNVCTATPLSDFATGGRFLGVRVLPDGGALVLRDHQPAVRYSAAGVVTRTYPATTDKSLIAITFADGGTRAIATTYCIEEIHAIDIDGGGVTKLGEGLYDLEHPNSIVPYHAWTAALGASHLPTVPTASELALFALAALLAFAAILRMR